MEKSHGQYKKVSHFRTIPSVWESHPICAKRSRTKAKANTAGEELHPALKLKLVYHKLRKKQQKNKPSSIRRGFGGA